MDKKEKVLELIKLIDNDFDFQIFEYKKEFIEEWVKYINNIDYNVVYFLDCSQKL